MGKLSAGVRKIANSTTFEWVIFDCFIIRSIISPIMGHEIEHALCKHLGILSKLRDISNFFWSNFSRVTWFARGFWAKRKTSSHPTTELCNRYEVDPRDYHECQLFLGVNEFNFFPVLGFVWWAWPLTIQLICISYFLSRQIELDGFTEITSYLLDDTNLYIF